MAAKTKAKPKTPLIYEQQIEQVPLDQLHEHPKNPRQGDDGAIHELVHENGFYGVLIVQRSTGYVLAGNTRLRVLRQAAVPAAPCIRLDVDDERALKILLGDNRGSDLASYADDLLAQLLENLVTSGAGLIGTGYDGDALDELKRRVEFGETEDDGGEAGGDGRGDLLALAKIGTAEPVHRPERGERYRLGPRHHLVVADPAQHWEAWRDLFNELATADGPELTVCLYPNPLIPHTQQAEERRLLMIQPDTYLAGHLLDRWVEQHGPRSIRKLT